MSWLSWHPLDGRLVRESRFVVSIKGYRFNRLIFLGAVFFLFIIFLTTLSKYGDAQMLGWSCPKDSPGWCRNPFYDAMGNCVIDDSVACADALLPPGSVVGQPISQVVSRFPEIALLSIVLAFVLNHLLYNRGVVSGGVRHG